MLKDIKKAIIDDIKCIIDNRKYYNSDYKKLVSEQYKAAKTHYDFYQDQEGNWEMYLSNTYQQSINDKRLKLLNKWHNDQFYHLIYKDGSERIFSAEDIITGETTHIKFTNLVYMRLQFSEEDVDTEIGKISWDVSIDEQFEARENYLSQIEIKYNTKWGLKQLAG